MKMFLPGLKKKFPVLMKGGGLAAHDTGVRLNRKAAAFPARAEA